MKVLHCIPGMGGGGAERQLAYLAAPLRNRGWHVHVALVTGGPNLARLESGGAVIHRLGGTRNHDPRLLWRIVRTIRAVRPDLVQVWFVQMDVLAGAAAELLGVPWIMSERSSLLAYPATLKNRLRATIARTADAIVSNSRAGDEYWQARVGARVQRFVVPNALPIDEIEAVQPGVPAGLAIAPDQEVILFAGRFGAEKNVAVLVDALREIVKRPRTVAVLCGDGPLRAEIKQAASAGPGDGGRVLFPGYVAELWPLMKRARVVVSVGLFEGRPNAVLEAMAAGCPVVVSDIPAHREFLDEHSAAFVHPRDPAAIARAVREVLADPSSARRRADVARQRVSAWSLEDAAAEYDRVYRTVLAWRGGARGVTARNAPPPR